MQVTAKEVQAEVSMYHKEQDGTKAAWSASSGLLVHRLELECGSCLSCEATSYLGARQELNVYLVCAKGEQAAKGIAPIAGLSPLCTGSDVSQGKQAQETEWSWHGNIMTWWFSTLKALSMIMFKFTFSHSIDQDCSIRNRSLGGSSAALAQHPQRKWSMRRVGVEHRDKDRSPCLCMFGELQTLCLSPCCHQTNIQIATRMPREVLQTLKVVQRCCSMVNNT